MELRVLQYFLAVTREQNISGAAESLHLTQPTLSRQLKDLEDELGKPLFIRSNRRITLTEEGMILKKRAEEILSLVNKTEQEISSSEDHIFGDVYIGGGESDGMRYLLRSANALRKNYPDIHFHIISDDQEAVLENLDRGLIDFGVILGDIFDNKYNKLTLNYQDTFGVLMKKDDPLAKKKIISTNDLLDKPLIISQQMEQSSATEQLHIPEEHLNIIGTYNLLFNGSLMVEEGMGYAIGLDHIINTTSDSQLVFRPLERQFDIKFTILWKKYQIFAKPAQKYLEQLRADFNDYNNPLHNEPTHSV